MHIGVGICKWVKFALKRAELSRNVAHKDRLWKKRKLRFCEL